MLSHSVLRCPILTEILPALRFVPGQAEKIDAKFAFIAQHDLGWVFASAVLVLLTRAYLTINSNGARAAARLD
eukprot:817536-Rhodomonas_salina.1